MNFGVFFVYGSGLDSARWARRASSPTRHGTELFWPWTGTPRVGPNCAWAGLARHDRLDMYSKLGEPTLILAILVEIISKRNLLGHNFLSDVSYQNMGIVLNGQGLDHHPLVDAPCRNLGTVVSKDRVKDRVGTSLVAQCTNA
jgi:hypothetical protein